MTRGLQVHIGKLKEILGEGILSLPGTVFFSGNLTLTAGNGVYLLGANPGGNPEDSEYDIEESLKRFELNPDMHSYIDDGYKDQEQRIMNVFQKNLKLVFDRLELDLRKTCSSNLVFRRSKTFKDISKKVIPDYLKAHEYIINSALHPSVIITLGKHAYNALKNCWQDDLCVEPLRSSKVISPAIQSKDGTKLLLYVPHPSYERWFSCFRDEPKIAKEMKDQITSALEMRKNALEIKWNLKV